jgi:hypothetical protein
MGDPVRYESTQSRVNSGKSTTMAVDLFEILPHKLKYQDGCNLCSA